MAEKPDAPVDTYPIRVRWPWGSIEIVDVPASQFYVGDDPAYRGGPAYNPDQLKSLEHVTLQYRFPDVMPAGTPAWLMPAGGHTLEVLLEEIGVTDDGDPLFAVARIEKPEDLQ